MSRLVIWGMGDLLWENRFVTGPVLSCINRKMTPVQGGLESLGMLRNPAAVESGMV